MTAALAKPDEPAFDLELIRRTVAQGATDDELALYLHDCQRRGVHPLDKLLHFTKRGGRYTPITSIDLFRARAGATGLHAGTEDAVFVEGDGGWPVAAQVTVYRVVAGVRCPFTATARWDEYCPDSGPMWRKMPRTMLAKCAEALALRKAFPQELGGLYTADEMDQAGGPMTVEANSLSPAAQAAARAANPPPPPVAYVTDERLEDIASLGRRAGLTPADWSQVLREYRVKRLKMLTTEQAQRLTVALLRRLVAQGLERHQLNLDDVRREAPEVAADLPDELTEGEARRALAALDEYQRQPAG